MQLSRDHPQSGCASFREKRKYKYPVLGPNGAQRPWPAVWQGPCGLATGVELGVAGSCACGPVVSQPVGFVFLANGGTWPLAA